VCVCMFVCVCVFVFRGSFVSLCWEYVLTVSQNRPTQDEPRARVKTWLKVEVSREPSESVCSVILVFHVSGKHVVTNSDRKASFTYTSIQLEESPSGGQ